MSRELTGKLADTWARLARRRFVCTDAAIESQKIVGGVVYGYWEEDNPEAELDRGCGGHDFLIVDDRWLLDFWAAAYIGERPIYDLHDSGDDIEVKRLYGPRDKWQPVNLNPNESRFLDD